MDIDLNHLVLINLMKFCELNGS